MISVEEDYLRAEEELELLRDVNYPVPPTEEYIQKLHAAIKKVYRLGLRLGRPNT